jgi:hypothetical protein
LSALVRKFRARRSNDSSTGERGASHEVRAATAERFRASAIRLRVDLGVLASGPPGFVGAFWTWPVYVRLLNRFPAVATEHLDAFLAVETASSSSVIEMGELVMVASAECLEAYGKSSGRRSADVFAGLERMDEALVAFVRTVRRDLGYDASSGN